MQNLQLKIAVLHFPAKILWQIDADLYSHQNVAVETETMNKCTITSAGRDTVL